MKKTDWLILILSILIGLEICDLVTSIKCHPRIERLEKQVELKDKQIDGLYEQNQRQTKLIAELTGNGG